MNTKTNKELFESNQVVALRAYKGKVAEDEFTKITTELGNPKQAIPMYAIYGPGLPEPIVYSGPISFGQVNDAIAKALGDIGAPVTAFRLPEFR